MTYPYAVLYFVGLIVSLTLCPLTNGSETDTPTMPGDIIGDTEIERVMREISLPSSSKCKVYETPSEPGLTRIIQSEGNAFSFYFKPLPGFRKLVFRVIIDNELDFSGQYEWTTKSLEIHTYELGNDTVGKDGWLPVKVEHYLHNRPLKPDSLALNVTVGARGSTKKALTTRNRLTHDYRGFTAYMDGSARVSFGCYPSYIISPTARNSQMQTKSSPSLIVGVILGGGFLLVVTAMLIILLLRRRNTDHPPPIPKPLSNDMLLMHRGQVRTEPEPTYEEFDEDTLARLRRKLDLDNLGCIEEREVLKDGKRHRQGGRTLDATAKRPQQLEGACGFSARGQDSQTVENVYENARTLRLQEEKEQAWKEDPELGTPPEGHYVEMHGIVSRTTSLNK